MNRAAGQRLAAIPRQTYLDVGIGFLIAVTVAVLLLKYERPAIAALQTGAVATADIIAPKSLKAEDVAETARRKEQAAANIPPVFDYLPREAKAARNSIESLFATGRATPRDAGPRDLAQEIERNSSMILDDLQVAVLVNHRFNSELEMLMIDHLEAVTLNGVVNRRQLLNSGSAGIVRRDVKAGQELIITEPLSTVRDLITARAELRSDRLIWPVEYSDRDRRLLGEILGTLVAPNLSYNESETEARRSAARDSVPPIIVSVEKGKPIVVAGEIITPTKADLLKAAAAHYPTSQRALELGGTLIIVTLLLLVLWQYMSRYQQRHLRIRRHFLLQATVFVITLLLARIFFTLGSIISQWAAHAPFNSLQSYRYLAPLAVGAVLVTLLTDAHAAFVFSAILMVLIGIISGNVYLAAYTLICSAGAIYHLKGCRDRTMLIRAGMWIGLVNAAGALALDLLGANDLGLGTVLLDAFAGFASGALAAMIASVILPLYEWLFQITTDIKLLELSNLNLPLLKRLAEQAPGTYHHSIMVGLLAEAGAEAIGADALFARVSCYYHDIGKLLRPTYFVENQSYMDNRHDRLSPKMSSIVLANHVKQGIELAREYKLPPRIISIIPEHHGTGLMKFFYYKAREEAGAVDTAALEKEFRYPGPKPQSKEAAIIMIADSVEAAARTVKEPTPAKLRNMIDMIIGRIRDDGQLDECNINLRELRLVAESFVKVLTGIHHHRIPYPGFDFNRAGVDIEITGPQWTEQKTASAESAAAPARTGRTGELRAG